MTGPPTAEPSSGAERRRALVALTGGNAAATLAAVAVQPVLARLFTPAQFGAAETFVALLTVAFPVASLRYEDALALPDSDDEARAVWHLAALLSVGAVAAVALAPLASPVLAGGAYASLVPFLGWLAPALLALRVQRLGDAWLVRTRRLGWASATNVAGSVGTSGARVGLGVAGVGHGLVSGFVLGNALGAAAQIVAMARAGLFRTWPSLRAVRAAAVRYRRFAFLTAPSALLAALSSRLPLLALAALFPLDVVGYLGRVLLVVGTPMGLVGGAASRVLVADGARAHREGRLARVALDTHRLLARVGTWPMLALLLAGPAAFAVVFGAGWGEAGVYARLCAPWLVLATHAATLTPIFDLTERHRRDLGATLLLTVGVALALVGAWQADLDARATVAALAGTGAVLRLSHLAALLHGAGVSLRDALAAWRRPLGVATAALVPVAALVATGASDVAVTGALALSGGAYAVAMLRS